MKNLFKFILAWCFAAVLILSVVSCNRIPNELLNSTTQSFTQTETTTPESTPTAETTFNKTTETTIPNVVPQTPHVHTEEVLSAISPTCTETGLTEGLRCSECNIILIAQEIIPTLEHTYTMHVTAPNGTTEGCTEYVCSCGNVRESFSWLDLSFYNGKTIACIGDSITAGVGTTVDVDDYVTQLANILGMNYIRLGASGTVLSTGGHRACNVGQLTPDVLKGVDVVTILMGVNDWDQAREGFYTLGNINSTDTSTIYGAVRMWCERIVELRQIEECSDTQFYFLTPVITSWNNSIGQRDWSQSKTNIHGYNFRQLCNAIIEVASLYNIPVIDLNLTSGIYYINAEENNISDIQGDGIHLNGTAHSMMATAIANALLQNDTKTDHVHEYGPWITTTYPIAECNRVEKRVCSICSKIETK